jgi:hypothetical protein
LAGDRLLAGQKSLTSIIEVLAAADKVFAVGLGALKTSKFGAQPSACQSLARNLHFLA